MGFLFPSYLYDGIFYTGQITSLWTGPRFHNGRKMPITITFVHNLDFKHTFSPGALDFEMEKNSRKLIFFRKVA